MIGVWLAGALVVAAPAWPQGSGKAQPDAAKAAYDQAQERELQGDLPGAYERYRLAAEDYPGTEWGRRAGERRDAIMARLTQRAAPSPGQAVLLSLLGLVYWLGGLLVLGALFGFFGWRAGWFWEWALIARLAEVVDGSVSRFRNRRKLLRELEARKANPRDGRARYVLGVLYFQQRRFDLAAEELAEAVALDPDRVDAQYHLGLACLQLRRPADAVAPLERVVARKPSHGGDALVRLGEAQLAAGDAPAAEASCREAMTLAPGDAESRYFLALALDAQGKRDEPPPLLEEAVRLGRAYRGTRRRQALAAARRARAYLRTRKARG